MRTSIKNNQNIDKDEIKESIVRSMIASFRIEKINISEETAQVIYRRVRRKLKKAV